MIEFYFTVAGTRYALTQPGDIITLAQGGGFNFTAGGVSGGAAASLDVDNQPGQQSAGQDITVKQSFIGGGGSWHCYQPGDYVKMTSIILLGHKQLLWEIKAGGTVHSQISPLQLAQDTTTPVGASQT